MRRQDDVRLSVTFQIEAHEDEHRQLVAQVTVDEERMTSQMRRTARRLAQELRVPGFRPGKAPYHIIVSQVGEETLRFEALDDMWTALLDEVLTQLAPDMTGEPQLDDLKIKPTSFTLIIPLRPQVKLGDYRTLRRDIQPVAITDAALDERLEQIRAAHTDHIPADRPAAMGDMLVVAGQGYLSDDPTDIIFQEERFEIILTPDAVYPGTGFADHLVGATPGDERNFTLTFPTIYEPEPAWQEKSATFNLIILDVFALHQPELDDALAQEEGFESLAELREALADDLQHQAETQHRNDAYEYMVEQMVEGVQKLRYPPVLVAEYQDKLIEDMKRQAARSDISWEAYLQHTGKTEQDLRDELEEQAVGVVERSLVIREFARQEKLRVTQNEVMAHLDEITARYSNNEALWRGVREYLLKVENIGGLIDDILTNKIYDRIVAILSGSAPDVSALDAESLEDSVLVMEEEPAATPETVETPELAAEETTVSLADSTPESGDA